MEQAKALVYGLFANFRQELRLGLELCADESNLSLGSPGLSRVANTLPTIQIGLAAVTSELMDSNVEASRIIPKIFSRTYAQTSLPEDKLPSIAPRLLPPNLSLDTVNVLQDVSRYRQSSSR
jgi:hypothetical protein